MKNSQTKHSHKFWPTVIATGIIVLLTVYFLFPIFWQIIATSKTSNELATTNGLLPSIPPNTWENIKALFAAEGGVYPRWFVNSLIYSGIGGALSTLLSGIAGYVLAFLKFKGRTLVTVVILIGTLVPATVLAFPLYLLLAKMNLIDTYWAFLLPSLVSPLAVFLSIMFAQQSIPYEVIEAARIDGMGEIRIAFGIGLPLMSTGLVTVLLLQVIAIWNNFFLPLMVLTSSDLYPATLGLYMWNSRVTQSPDYQVLVLVGALIACIPLVILFLALQRQLKAGLTAGAVKA
ncbi:MAG: carbohydrate ABC transporter permease [Arachnia sp.]